MKRMQLEYFVRIVEEKSFTKAAEKLFISQPALSKSIRALEAELGVTLFKRDPRELSLTSEGERLLLCGGYFELLAKPYRRAVFFAGTGKGFSAVWASTVGWERFFFKDSV